MPTPVDVYLTALSDDRRAVMEQLRRTLVSALPPDFEETMQYGMISFVVPHAVYPAGYHVDPTQPLPFISIASQKYGIGLYHMGLYASPALLDWFTKAYASACTTKLDMGKSCIRLKQLNAIPYDLIADLAAKMTVQEWITLYEASRG
jgi:uncharacterized protein YdhG (YjbR/CyaY superfamily)